MGGWQPRRLALEALANLTAAPVRLCVLAGIIAGLTGAIVWLELTAIDRALDREAAFTVAGGYIGIAASENGLDAGFCARLSQHDAVIASGGYSTGGLVASATSPRVTFQRLHATDRLTTVWDPSYRLTPGSYAVGQAAAAELGVRTGSWLQLLGSTGAPVSVFDPGERNSFASRAIVAPVPPVGNVSECWVEFAPSHVDAGLNWLRAEFAATDVVVRRAADRGAFADDPAELIASRVTRWSWLPAAIIAVAVVALLAWARRADVAVYRSFGVPRSGVLLMLQVEAIVITGSGLLIGTIWAIGLRAMADGPLAMDQWILGVRTGAAFALTMMAIGPLAAVLASAGSPAQLLKER